MLDYVVEPLDLSRLELRKVGRVKEFDGEVRVGEGRKEDGDPGLKEEEWRDGQRGSFGSDLRRHDEEGREEGRCRERWRGR